MTLDFFDLIHILGPDEGQQSTTRVETPAGDLDPAPSEKEVRTAETFKTDGSLAVRAGDGLGIAR
jgi:hypothetical protein